MASRLTDFEVLYELVDIDAKADASYTATNVKNFSHIPQLGEMQPFPDTMTLEHNHTILDESLIEFPDSTSDIIFYSETMSDENGQWQDEDRPTLDIAFDDLHSSYSLTLGLVNDQITKIRVTWYYFDEVLMTKVFNADETGLIREDVENYNHITIEFVETIPYRYIKMYGVYYGIKLNWNSTNMKQGKMTKEVNITSERLPVDTLNFQVVDVTFGDFNLGNQSGIHRFFQRNQPLYAYEWIDEEQISLGKFFLKGYEHDANLGKFSCVSYIDIADNIPFNTGTLYNGILAGELLEQIFELLGIEDYEIDTVTYNQKLYGTIKPQSCRGAIREILFACQSVIDTSNPDKIYVYKLNDLVTGTIHRSTKFDTSVQTNAYISGITVEYPTYAKVTAPSNIIRETFYDAGEHLVVFSQPYSDIEFDDETYLTDIEISTYYVKFTATQNVTLNISGYGYTEIFNSAEQNKELDAGEFENVKTFKSYLSNYENAKRIARILLNFYTYEMEIKIKALATDVDMFGRYVVENSKPAYDDYVGNFSSRTFDLTGGFIQDSKLSMSFLDKGNKIYFNKEAGKEEIFNDYLETALI